jgi:hypothetical protein
MHLRDFGPVLADHLTHEDEGSISLQNSDNIIPTSRFRISTDLKYKSLK